VGLHAEQVVLTASEIDSDLTRRLDGNSQILGYLIAIRRRIGKTQHARLLVVFPICLDTYWRCAVSKEFLHQILRERLISVFDHHGSVIECPGKILTHIDQTTTCKPFSSYGIIASSHWRTVTPEKNRDSHDEPKD